MRLLYMSLSGEMQGGSGSGKKRKIIEMKTPRKPLIYAAFGEFLFTLDSNGQKFRNERRAVSSVN